MYTLNGWIIKYMNYISVKLFFYKRKILNLELEKNIRKKEKEAGELTEFLGGNSEIGLPVSEPETSSALGTSEWILSPSVLLCLTSFQFKDWSMCFWQTESRSYTHALPAREAGKVFCIFNVYNRKGLCLISWVPPKHMKGFLDVEQHNF